MSRELDAKIAEEVIGFIWRWTPNGTKRLFPPLEEMVLERVTDWRGATDPDWDRSIPHYSTDIAAAERVIDVMAERGYWCQMRTPFEKYGKGDYWAGFTPHSTTGWNGTPDNWTSAETLPLAICRAALAALGRKGESTE